jgi:hypothetical protein
MTSGPAGSGSIAIPSRTAWLSTPDRAPVRVRGRAFAWRDLTRPQAVPAASPMSGVRTRICGLP